MSGAETSGAVMSSSHDHIKINFGEKMTSRAGATRVLMLKYIHGGGGFKKTWDPF